MDPIVMNGHHDRSGDHRLSACSVGGAANHQSAERFSGGPAADDARSWPDGNRMRTVDGHLARPFFTPMVQAEMGPGQR